MNDYWLSAQAQWRVKDIRREFAHIRLAQSVSPMRVSPRFSKLTTIVGIVQKPKMKGDSHERAGRAILAVD